MDVKKISRRIWFGGIFAVGAGVLHALLSAWSLLPEPWLLLEASNKEAELPTQFRTSSDPIASKEFSTEGLRELHIAGSAQFSARELKVAMKRLSFPIYLVDLRQECHGFLNGNAISWYSKRNAGNFGKPLDVILREEAIKIQALQKEKEVVLHTTKPHSHKKDEPQELEVFSAITEEELVRPLGLQYLRLPVTDHFIPDPETVDRFLEFAKTLPTGSWIYFHCRGGEGRTGTFMAMWDMLHNAKRVSFEDILNRQWHLGGHNLADLPQEFNWRAFKKEERYSFLHQFYEFCQQNKEKYTEWLKNKNHREQRDH